MSEPVSPTDDVDLPSPSRRRRVAAAIVGDLAYTYSVIWALAIVVIVFGLLRPVTFLTLSNAQSILGSQAVLLMLAVGLTVPLAANEFDLSIGSMAGMSQIVLGTLTVQHGWNLGVALLVTVAVGTLVGLLNATIVVKLGVSSFITTLGMSALLDGLAIKITNSSTIPGLPNSLIQLSAGKFLGLQMVFWYGLAATVVLWYVLRQTPLGQRIYFTGTSRDVARLNGVRVDRIRAGSLVTSAIVASVAGVLYAGSFGSADPFSGSTFLLPAFAAAFLGATSFTPGRFNAWGTFFSIYVVITGVVGLSLVTNQTGWISFVFNGGVLIAAVSLQRIVAIRRVRPTKRSAVAPGEAHRSVR